MKDLSEISSGNGEDLPETRNAVFPPVPRGYPKRQERPESEPEYEILHYLRQQGFATDSQVWDAELRYRIDLAVKNPATGHYVLAIEYDGQAYHTKPADRDNDIYRQERLEERGWKFFRMDIAWYHDPAASRRKLTEAVNQAVQADSLRYGISPNRPGNCHTEYNSQLLYGSSREGRDTTMDENNMPSDRHDSKGGNASGSNSASPENRNIEIEIISRRYLNLALYQAGFPLISDIRFFSPERDFEDITIQISCDYEVFEPMEIKADVLQRGSRISVSGRLADLRLKVAKFAELTETVATSVEVTVVNSFGELIAWASEPLEITPYNQWNMNQELLAAFVTPNSPPITQLVGRAEELLRGILSRDDRYASREFPGFNGYQSQDPQYVALQAEALYTAARELGLTYRMPPASFEGQRVRSVTQIINEKAGTCLDTTCFYASLLEHAGLRPLLFLVDGHAFAGVELTEEPVFHDPVVTDRDLVYRARERQDILMVETTCLSQDVLFNQAADAAGKNFAEKTFQGCVAIAVCRERRIKPLPEVSRDAAGALVLTEDPRFVRDLSSESGSVAVKTNMAMLKQGGPVTREQIWENKLLDLTTRNRLLNMKTSAGAVARIYMSDPDKLEDVFREHDQKFFKLVAVPEVNAEFFNKGMNPETLELTPELNDMVIRALTDRGMLFVKNETRKSLEQVLKKLASEAKSSNDENGANSLFLSLFSVLWQDDTAAKKQHEAPLFLLPVDIKKESRGESYAIKVRDEELMVNYSLIELMRQLFGIDLRASLSKLPLDEFGVAVDEVKDMILQVLPPGWKILKTVCLGNFSFRKFVMWQDLSNNSEMLRSRSAVYASLADGKCAGLPQFGPEEVPETVDDRVPFGKICQPIQADSSQLDAVMAAMSGKSFVLEGPPGTGKSQTITNIIASALEAKKKVLFVAAKMAALEVVQDRLTKLGLAPFCLELHSNTMTKSRFLERLSITVPDPETSAGMEYEIVKNRLNAARKDLNAEVTALHTPIAAGMSVYGAFGELLKTGQEPGIAISPDNLPDIDAAMIQDADQALRELKILVRDQPLNSYTFFESALAKRPEGSSGLDAAAFGAAVRGLRDGVKAVTDLMGFASSGLTLERLQGILSGIEEALGREDMDFALLSLPDIPGFVKEAGAGADTALRIREDLRKLGPNAEDVFQLNLREELKIWKLDSQRFFIMRYLAHGKSVGRLQRALGAEVKVTSDNYEELMGTALGIQDLKNSLNEALEKVRRMNGDFAALLEKDPEKARGLLDTLDALHGALSSGLEPGEKSSLREALSKNAVSGDFRERLQALTAFKKPFAEFSEGVKKLKEFYSIDDTLLPGDPLKLADRAQGWADRPGDIGSWLEVNKRLRTLRMSGFAELVRALLEGRVPASAGEGYARALFAKSLIEWQFSQNEALSEFHPEIFEDRIARFNEDAASFRKLSGQHLIEQLTAEKNQLKNSSDAAIQEEITFFEKAKKSRGRGSSIRQIFNKTPHLMPGIAPCMLMSPISVAQYLDPSLYSFDLIIFDEASQLPTSEAVGAIGRGHQVIVVGDPKQMPPTDFFEARQAEEESDIADLESVLDDCMTLGMPVKTLSWHYRSRHESLISFSNTMYYESRLYTFPSPDDMNSRVQYHFVNGVYDRGGKSTNPDESKAVTAYIRDFLKDPRNSNTSVGIVTFNSKQQAQIDDDLADMFRDNPDLDAKANSGPEPLFVKNLENVQGDERDVIVFSVGFGRDKDGKVSMNFGPLNRDGGERRLNVAVTRAKKEMVVFTSIEPEDGRITAATSRGVSGLFEFLKYARNGTSSITRQLETGRREKDILVEKLAEILKEAGFDSRTGVGTSSFRVDLAVRDPGNPDRYLAGIMADGLVYRNTPCAVDRFSGQPGVLRGLGWKILRFWTPDFWKNRESVVASLTASLRELEAAARAEEAARNENNGA